MPPNALQTEWDRRLRADGFGTLQTAKGSDRVIAIPDRQIREGKPELAQQLRADMEYLHRGHFRSKLDRRIWELHCDGLGQREIAVDLGVGRSVIARAMKRVKMGRVGSTGRLTGRKIKRTILAMPIQDVFELLGKLVD